MAPQEVSSDIKAENDLIEMHPNDGTHEASKVSKRKRYWYEVDGRFGWVQVFAVGITYFLLIGLNRSFSLLYQQLIMKYQRSDSITSWVPSVHGSVKMFSSPLVGFLIMRHNERRICFVGAVTASVSLALTAVSPSIEYVFLFYGLFFGFGVNCCIIPSQTIITKYFEKKRGRALGFAVSSGPLGALALSPLIQLLFDYYDYRGAMLVLSAIVAHTCLSAALMRPLPNMRCEPLKEKGLPLMETEFKANTKNESCTSSESDIPVISESPRSNKQPLDYLSLNQSRSKPDKCDNRIREEILVIESDVDYFDQQNHDIGNRARTKSISGRKSDSVDDCAIAISIKKPNPEDAKCKDSEVTKYSGDEYMRISEKNNLFVPAPLETAAIILVKNDEIGKCQKILNSISSAIGLTLLKDYQFVMYCGLFVCYAMCVNVTGIFLTVLIQEYGYSEAQAVTLLLIYNSIDVPCRLISGLIYDHKVLRNYKVWISAILFSSAALCQVLLPLALGVHFVLAMVCLGVAGFGWATVITQNPNVIVTLFGSAQCATAISLARFFQGIGMLISGPLVGFLKDMTGKYAIGYMIVSSLMLLPALIFFLSKLICKVKPE